MAWPLDPRCPTGPRTEGGVTYLGRTRVSSLTQTRVVVGGAAGELTDDSRLTYDPDVDTFTAGTVSAGHVYSGDLTNGRVVLAGTAGRLADNMGLTFDGTTLTAPTVAGTNVTSGADPGHTHTAYSATSHTHTGYVNGVQCSGTAYTLTATPAYIETGTAKPEITIAQAGTYLLLARVHVYYNAATFAANRLVTIKIRRTNNTAADLITGTAFTAITTTVTQTMISGVFLYGTYTTANTDDVIQLWGDVNVLPSAGSIDVIASGTRVTAIKVSPL